MGQRCVIGKDESGGIIMDGNERVIVVQARMSSSRLPGKVLLDLAGQPLLVRIWERIARAGVGARIVVATTVEPQDDCIVDLCRKHKIDLFRGDPVDLLDRHYQVAGQYGASVVAKIPSDCPLIDPKVIEAVFERFSATGADYASNLHPATFPDGNDVEVMTAEALGCAWREARRPLEREHTTPFIWENPGRFSVVNVGYASGRGSDLSMSHRWTVDYPEDYQFVRRVYQELFPRNPAFGMDEILELLEAQPEIGKINQQFAGVNWYRHHLGELKTIGLDRTRAAPGEKPLVDR